MFTTAVIGFYGESKSGKTTLIVDIIKHLSKNGFKVATIKNTDKDIDIDTKGKDTWRHKKAGAELVILSSKKNTDIFINNKIKLDEIIKILSGYDYFDIILVEGANDPKIPKIKIGDIRERENTIMCFRDDFANIIQVIKEEIKKIREKQCFELTVNGQKIPLSMFPEDIIKNTVLGMISSLKGVDKINDFSIYFKNTKNF